MSLAPLDRPSPLAPEPTDDVTRRQLLAGMVALGLLSACGNEVEKQEETSVQPRSIADDRGEVTVPDKPVRIVATGEESTELVVALGLTLVGIGSSRVDATKGDRALDGYYLSPQQIGSPAFVGPGPFNFEAITALNPDLIVHFSDDENVPTFEQIAPTVVYDVTVPGAWQEALRKLARGVERERQADDLIRDFTTQLEQAKQRLAPIAARAPRISVIYPNYRDGGDNFVFDSHFALAEVFIRLGFELVGIEKAEEVFPGVGSISLERLGDIDSGADTIIALGPVNWTETPSGPILSSLEGPVLWVPLDDDRPSSGPLTSPALLRTYVEVIEKHYRA